MVPGVVIELPVRKKVEFIVAMEVEVYIDGKSKF